MFINLYQRKRVMDPLLELCVETSLRERRIYLPDRRCEVHEYRLAGDSHTLLVIYFQRPGFCSRELNNTGITLLPEVSAIRYQFQPRGRDGHVIVPPPMIASPAEE